MSAQLETYRVAAKQLKKQFAAGDPQAVARVAAIMLDQSVPKHADFLHIIAREAGHPSWPRLKFALEAAEMDRDQRAERLKMALYFGQKWVVRDMLAADPDLTNHNLGLQIATYDLKAVKTALRNPDKATKAIGPRSPILHLAFSLYIHMAPEKLPDMLEIARLLVEAGADVNDGYIAEAGTDHKLSALYGALGHARNLVLAEWLLDHGADPNDNESLYHSTELDDTRGLELVLRHGAKPEGTNALARALDFNDIAKVRLLLDYGANPQEGADGHPSGQQMIQIPALHQAARRYCSAEIAQLLLDHGADGGRIWQDHTAYALARIFGNGRVAETLAQNGHAHPLSNSEQQLADCADGHTPTSRIDTAGLTREDQRLLTRLATYPGRLRHLELLVLCGLEPNHSDEMGLPPLHIAVWEGNPEYTEYFLSLGPDLTRKNAYGGDALGTVLHGAEQSPNRATRDHLACTRLLLEAGAELRPEHIKNCGVEDLATFLEDWRASDI